MLTTRHGHAILPLVTDRTALPPSWPEPPTDPPDDDPDGAEFLDDWYKHDCDDGDMWCPPCIACHLATGETVCQFTCEHRKDLE